MDFDIGDLGEAVGEGLGALAFSNGNKEDKDGCGCAIIFTFVLIVIGLILWFDYKRNVKENNSVAPKVEQVKVIGKYPENTLGVHTHKGDTLIKVNEDLYNNTELNKLINLKVK